MSSIESSLEDVADFVWDVASSMRDAQAPHRLLQAQCGLLRPLCGLLQPLYELLQNLCGMLWTPYGLLQPPHMLHKSYGGCCILCVGFHSLRACCKGSMWLFHLLCGLSQHLCGLQLSKTGNADIVFRSGYCTITNILHTCHSLTTRINIDMRFEPRSSRPATITENEGRERRQGTKTGNEDRELRQGKKTATKTGNQGME